MGTVLYSLLCFKPSPSTFETNNSYFGGTLCSENYLSATRYYQVEVNSWHLKKAPRLLRLSSLSMPTKTVLRWNKSPRRREVINHQSHWIKILIFRLLAFPNAKVSPPKRGDNDFMMRSNKLNSDKHLLHHLLKSNIDFHWETLWNEFTAIDRQGTGTVSRKDFMVS